MLYKRVILKIRKLKVLISMLTVSMLVLQWFIYFNINCSGFTGCYTGNVSQELTLSCSWWSVYMAPTTVCLAIHFCIYYIVCRKSVSTKTMSITTAPEEKNYCCWTCPPISVSHSVRPPFRLVTFSIRCYQLCSPTPGLSYHSVKEVELPHNVLSQADWLCLTYLTLTWLRNRC